MIYKEVIFTSDLLRVDKTQKIKLNNPQKVNIDWLYELFYKEIQVSTSLDTRKIIANKESDIFSRLKTYKDLGLPITTESWIKIYEGNYKYNIIEEHLSKTFNKQMLIIGFELPKYMIKFFLQYNISYIDFTIHPIRFLDDYIFAMRTNVDEYRKKILNFKIPDELFYDSTKIFKAKSKRIFQKDLHLNSAVFLGQTEIDASLIHNGSIPDIELIEYTLRTLTDEFEHVYYKAHPHSKIIQQLKNIVNKIPNCEWLESNIYMLLPKEEIDLFVSFSSGSLEEAKYFDRKIKRVLSSDNYFDLNSDLVDSLKYYPITSNIYSLRFWNYLFNDKEQPKIKLFDPYEKLIKKTLNMKWGQ